MESSTTLNIYMSSRPVAYNEAASLQRTVLVLSRLKWQIQDSSRQPTEHRPRHQQELPR